jgi:hypothetical protein
MSTVDIVSGKINEVQKITRVDSVGSKDGTAGVHIAAFPCPKVNDSGVTGVWDWRVAASTAVALLSTAAAFQIADMQYQTAKAYWRLARERWDYFLGTYRPCEVAEVAEACTATADTDYNTAINAYTSGAALAYSNADKEILRLGSLYCVCPDGSLAKDADLMRSQMVGDGVNYAMRRAEAVKESLDDVNWNRRIGVLNRGRGLLAQSTSYARSAQEMYDQFGKSVSAVASGATQFLGYALNRNETTYPTRTGLEKPGAYGFGNVMGDTGAFASGTIPMAGQDTGMDTPLGYDTTLDRTQDPRIAAALN